jgi:FtsH-binding integral membrane protein
MYKPKNETNGKIITIDRFFSNSFLRAGFMILISGLVGVAGRFLTPYIITSFGLSLGFLIASLVLITGIDYFINKSLIAQNTNTLGLLCYANVMVIGFVTGVTTSIYHVELLAKALFLTTIVFSSTAIYGYLTKKDMSQLSVVLKILFIVSLVLFSGGFVVSFFNKEIASWIFSLEAIISIIFSIVFIIYFMDFNKKIYNTYKHSPSMLQIHNIHSSYILFSTFINIFLKVLRLLGEEHRRNKK